MMGNVEPATVSSDGVRSMMMVDCVPLPAAVTVTENLDLVGAPIKSLPAGFTAHGDLDLEGMSVSWPDPTLSSMVRRSPL